MAKDYTKQLMEILIVLKNINDNIHKVEDEMFDMNCKLNKEQTKTVKHLIVFREPKKEKDNK